jgi:hypothetical protein
MRGMDGATGMRGATGEMGARGDTGSTGSLINTVCIAMQGRMGFNEPSALGPLGGINGDYYLQYGAVCDLYQLVGGFWIDKSDLLGSLDPMGNQITRPFNFLGQSVDDGLTRIVNIISFAPDICEVLVQDPKDLLVDCCRGELFKYGESGWTAECKLGGPTGPTGPGVGDTGPAGPTGPSGGPIGPTGPMGSPSNIDYIHSYGGTLQTNVRYVVGTGIATTDESDATILIMDTCTIKALSVALSAAYTDWEYEFTVRRNGVDTLLAVVLPVGSTTVTNALDVACVAGDKISIKYERISGIVPLESRKASTTLKILYA